MSISVQISTYDVFASKQLAGNQLAVFTGCEELSTEQMQKLANEMNLAESTFLIRPTTTKEGSPLKYRIFTPEVELPFAGHPTLGTAYHAMKHVLPEGTKSLVLECKGGAIAVTEEGEGLLWMDQIPPTLQQDVDRESVAKALNCDINVLDKRFPCQLYSNCGTLFIVAPVDSLDSLTQLTHPGALMVSLCNSLGAVGIYLVTREGHYDPTNPHSVSARSFIAESSVPEDPATGSAVGCFAGWAVNTGYLPENTTFSVGQGYEMGRPSLLHVHVAKDGIGGMKVRVGGAVIPVLKGGQITLRA